MDEHLLTPPLTAHRRAWDAIPWVAAGAASDEDTRQVHEHLPLCAECRAEWALHQRVGRALQSIGSPPSSDAEGGWQRLAARIDADEFANPEAPSPVPGRTAAAAPWTRWLVAAVVVQAIGLGAAGLALRDRQVTADRDGDFRTLSQPAAAQAAASVRLVPAPQMGFGDLQPLLASTRMVAVEVGTDGASLGLAAADGDPRTVQAALPLLRAAPGVLLAEPVAPLPR